MKDFCSARSARNRFEEALAEIQRLKPIVSDDPDLSLCELQSQYYIGETYAVQEQSQRGMTEFAAVESQLLQAGKTRPLKRVEHKLLIEALIAQCRASPPASDDSVILKRVRAEMEKFRQDFPNRETAWLERVRAELESVE